MYGHLNVKLVYEYLHYKAIAARWIIKNR